VIVIVTQQYCCYIDWFCVLNLIGKGHVLGKGQVGFCNFVMALIQQAYQILGMS